MAKDRIQERIDKYYNVGDLRKLIADLPDDTPIGRSGHFGEFCQLEEAFIGKAKVSASGSWRDQNNREIEILSMIIEDPGPDPD